MYCVYPDHKEDNKATHLVTVRRKPPRSEQYLMVCCEQCANNIIANMKCNVEYWDRIPRNDSENSWTHIVLTEIDCVERGKDAKSLILP